MSFRARMLATFLSTLLLSPLFGSNALRVHAATNLTGEVSLGSPALLPSGPFAKDHQFRETFGLNDDPDWVSSLHEAAPPGVGYRYGVPLAAAEQSEIDFRASQLQAAERSPALEAAIARHPEEFAGVYLDHRGGGIVTVLTTGDPSGLLSDLKSGFPYPDRLAVRAVRNSQVALEQLHGQLVRDQAFLWNLGIQGFGTDVIGNREEVMGPGLDATTVAALVARYGRVPIAVVPHAAFKLQGASGAFARPVRGGMELDGGMIGCTAGYILSDGTSYYVSTAAHCGGTTVTQGAAYTVGQVVKTTFSSGSTISADAEAVTLPGNRDGFDNAFNLTQTTLPDGSGSQFAAINVVQGQDADRINDVVCLSGRVAGLVCGAELMKDLTEFANNKTYQYQRLASVSGQDGDSGGAWINPSTETAVGSHVGGNSGYPGDGVFSHIFDLQSSLGLNVVAGTYANAVHHDNPALWYRLDDRVSTGQAQFDYLTPREAQLASEVVNSGYGGRPLDGHVVGHVVGVVTFGQPGAPINDPDTAASFSGAGTILVPAPGQVLAPTVTTFTAEAWFATQSAATEYVVALFGPSPSPNASNAGQPPVGLGLSGGVPFATVTDVNGSVHAISAAANQTDNDNTYHHIALTDDGTTLRLFIDGNQVASTAVTGPIGYNGNQGGAIGSDGTGNFFTGLIDEPAAYSSALSPSRVSYHASFGICSSC